MPTRRGSSVLSIRDPAFRPSRGRSDIPPRAKQLIELMTWDEMSRAEAAQYMGIKPDTARLYLALPGARRYLMSLLEQLRDSERPRNLHAAVGIRDDSEMQRSAAGNRARLEAVRFIEGERPAGPTVNIGLNVGVNVAPGYLVDVGEHRAALPQILHQAGSTASVLDFEAESDAP